MTAAVTHTGAIAARHIRTFRRQPWWIAISLMQPVIYLVLFGSSVQRAGERRRLRRLLHRLPAPRDRGHERPVQRGLGGNGLDRRHQGRRHGPHARHSGPPRGGDHRSPRSAGADRDPAGDRAHRSGPAHRCSLRRRYRGRGRHAGGLDPAGHGHRRAVARYCPAGTDPGDPHRGEPGDHPAHDLPVHHVHGHRAHAGLDGHRGHLQPAHLGGGCVACRGGRKRRRRVHPWRAWVGSRSSWW